ncbi:MAG: cell wall-binding protein [Clostridium butyricum]|nr:cell wall-binding protein [Clostridium butyricum]
MSKRILKILILFFTLSMTLNSTEPINKIIFFDFIANASEEDYLLKDIYIAGKYDIDFEPSVYSYSLDVPELEEDLLLKVEPKYKSDKVYVNGVEVLRDDKYRTFVDLDYGKNIINIDVRDSYDGKTYSYTLYVYRGGTESLTLDDINMDGSNIGFEANTRFYNIELDEDEELIRLNVVPKEGNYSVKVNGTLLGEKNTIRLKFNGINKYTINVTLIDNDTNKQSKYTLNFYLGIPISPDVEGSINAVLKPNQWILQNGRWRYNDFKGEYLRDAWLYDNYYGKWFYFNTRGYMQTGWLEHDDGNIYYLDNHGAMKTGWIIYQGKWYYLDQNGAMRNGWIKDKNKWYFLNEQGEMQTGWIQDKGKWYFLNSDGSMKTGWIIYNKEYYYLNENGSMQTGWLKYDNEWYYMDRITGAMKSGDWVFSNGNWYYINYVGTMRTGWLYKDDKYYYFNGDGTMNTITKTIDGYTYKFNKDGSVNFN